ncbi:SDH family Clp fold serine proteinase [Thalassovita sp.]|uniref:SDH family Clp fold serine proteinase n=1 Tax=Thalassovita sp. TaxID=1979401 RepID=UPI0029DE75F7|nr:ATP-dependent Clp protease proteolytic subunit [Thalassovita sp.]
MDIMNLIWLVFLMMALQPVLQKRLQEALRQRKIDEIQRQRGSRVIVLVHRQETMSLLGFPLVRYIDVQDSEQILRVIDNTDPDTPIDLVLHTPGGLVLAATQISRALKKHQADVRVLVPHYAMSGGTLLALAADQVVMNRHAVLGPIDPQIGDRPAASILSAVVQKSPEKVEDDTLMLADMAQKSLNQVWDEAVSLLSSHMDRDKAETVAEQLSSGQWTHDYPISAEQALDLGLPVSTDMPQQVMDLMRLYPQPTNKQGGVEYLPRK